MKTKALRFSAQNGLFAGVRCVVCAVSGGADSMALLHLLYTQAAEFGLEQVCACHLNHGLRGTESDAEEQLVRAFCEQNGIPLLVQQAALAETTLPQGMGLEAYARQLRYEFFEQAAAHFGAQAVATAHTLSDQTETVLFRIARGSGLKGAGGIPAKRDMFVRPLLEVSRSETECYCKENSIAYCLDSSNATDDYARNRIRHHAVPALKSVNAQCEQAVGRFAQLAARADALLCKQAQALLVQGSREGSFLAAPLLQADALLQEYAVMQLLQQTGISADTAMVQRCIEVLQKGGRTQLKGDFYFVRRKDEAGCEWMQPQPFVHMPLVPGDNLLQDGGVFTLSAAEMPYVHGKFAKELFYSAIDCDKVVGTLLLRTMHQGDSFTSPLRCNTKTLKKL
ncbi:MAG: tRNA lysidine(34) synthetase TilS, partial [Oscillospiraceae bacterium]|nr:tRNA lysidine(34) synthetase TilS [Oscillospiraceae bacterium]